MIYHGTPLTPRDALLAVCKGRAMCVSFWRPDDVEAVEAIAPFHHVRQRRVFGVARGDEARRGMAHPRGLDTLLRLAGTAPVRAGALGSNTGCTWGTVTAQRQPVADLAVWGPGRTALAHGRADRTAAAVVRAIPARLPWVDRGGQAPRHASLSRAHGGSRPRLGQPLAGLAHDARDRGGSDVSLRQCGRNHTRTEWVAL